jgi:hypothetical protein
LCAYLFSSSSKATVIFVAIVRLVVLALAGANSYGDDNSVEILSMA